MPEWYGRPLSLGRLSRARSGLIPPPIKAAGGAPPGGSMRSLGFQFYPGAARRERIAMPAVPLGHFFERFEVAMRVFDLTPWLLLALLLLLRVLPAIISPAAESALWYYIIVVGSFEALSYLMIIPLSAWDKGHGANAFGHLYCYFGPMNYTRPSQSGLTNARVVRVPTSDGETLGAWHVLPGGAPSREAAVAVAAGAPIDGVYDDALRRADSLAGVKAILYLHGMGY